MFKNNRLMLFSGLLISLFTFAQAYTQAHGFRGLASTLPLNTEMARNNQAVMNQQNTTGNSVTNNNSTTSASDSSSNPFSSAITNEQAYRQKQLEINKYIDQLKQERALWSAQRGGQSFNTPYDAQLRRLEMDTQSLNQARSNNIINSIIQIRFASTKSMTQAERDNLNEQATLLERLYIEMAKSSFQVMNDTTNLTVPAQTTVQNTLQQTKDAKPEATTTTPTVTPTVDTQVTQTVVQPTVQPTIDPNLVEAVVPTIVN